MLARPGHAGDDGNAVVDDEGAQVLAVVAEKGVVDQVLHGDGAALVPDDEGVGGYEGLEGVHGLDHCGGV